MVDSYLLLSSIVTVLYLVLQCMWLRYYDKDRKSERNEEREEGEGEEDEEPPNQYTLRQIVMQSMLVFACTYGGQWIHTQYAGPGGQHIPVLTDPPQF